MTRWLVLWDVWRKSGQWARQGGGGVGVVILWKLWQCTEQSVTHILSVCTVTTTPPGWPSQSLEPVPGQDLAGGATCSSGRPTGWNLSQLESDSRPGRTWDDSKVQWWDKQLISTTTWSVSRFLSKLVLTRNGSPASAVRQPVKISWWPSSNLKTFSPPRINKMFTINLHSWRPGGQWLPQSSSVQSV